MSLKEFLKPDWRKIVLTIVLFLIGIFSAIFTNSFYSIIPTVFLWPIAFLCSHPPAPEGEFPTYGPCILGGLIGLIIDIFYLYLISCLIIWVYNRVKKK
jgi:hypothetical protein